jgi:hypothetical protein
VFPVGQRATEIHFSENFLGKLVFELDHAVTFEDEVRFERLKIIEYLYDKIFKIAVSYTML